MIALPIDQKIPEILEALESTNSLVLLASPGAGKTTRVPPALMDAPFCKTGEIWVLEPRRLAAQLSARRIAEERGWQLGQEVGYQYRFENVTSSKTRLKFMTEGLLMRHLLEDPHLTKVSAVVLDEFHERHLHTDLALAVLKKLQMTSRPELRMIVMSATLDSQKLRDYLESQCVIEIQAKRFDLETLWKPEPENKRLAEHIRAVVSELLRRDVSPDQNMTLHLALKGDVLIFLPGMGEIRRAEEELKSISKEFDFEVLPLHGELTNDEQKRALTPQKKRRIILSTNIAETSLTIEGVSIVIDSGLCRQAVTSSWTGMTRLMTKTISKASATQRAGRAARTGAGLCVRLYSKGDWDGMAPFETPEIFRADLSQPYLELLAMGEASPESLPWYDPPEPSHLSGAHELLRRLGVFDSSSESETQLNELGKKLAKIPVHPRISRALFEAKERHCLPEVATLLAGVSEGRNERVELLEEQRSFSQDSHIQKIAERWVRVVGLNQSQKKGQINEEAILRSLLSGFSDRLAKLKKGTDDLTLSSGGLAKVSQAERLKGEFFLALDVFEKRLSNRSQVVRDAKSLIPVEVDWLLDLDPCPVLETDEIVSRGDRLEKISRWVCDGIVLSESKSQVNGGEAASRILAQSIMKSNDWDQGVCRQISERIEFLKSQLKIDIGFTLNQSWVEERLIELCTGCTRKDEVDLSGWESYLISVLPSEVAEYLSQQAPSELKLAHGRKLKIHYEPGKPPWVQSRLQDFFGQMQTPKIAGKISVVVHLLAPNQRAVQVTQDLASFWKGVYPELRKELSRRYPRHFWPENPAESEPPPPRPARKRN